MRLRVFVRNKALLELLERTPRGLFGLPEHTKKSLPGPTNPETLALMIDSLNLNTQLIVLEVGTGCGYQSALIAPLVRRLYTLESHPATLKAAQERFKILGLTNITTLPGKSDRGWPPQAPFDRILLMGALPEPPPALLKQLKPGGVMVAPLEKKTHQSLIRLTRPAKKTRAKASNTQSDTQIEEISTDIQFPPLF